MFPLEFVVAATPISMQASAGSIKAWKEAISAAAEARIAETIGWTMLDIRPLSVTILFFAAAGLTGDIDNIVKPILDGMIKVAYLDDRVVERVLVQKLEPDRYETVGNLSLTLARAVDTAPPVVYVRVDDDLLWRTVG